MPGDLPAWLWLLAFLVLQFSYSCFPPPRPPRPPIFTTPSSATTPAGATTPDGATTPAGATTPDDATTPDGATTPEGPTTPDAATTPDGPTTPDSATTPDAAITPDSATTPDGATTPPTAPTSETGTCNTTVFSESSILPHWPASNVLTESQDAQDADGRFNYWLGNENGKLILDLGCDSQVDQIDLINTKNAWAKDRATKRFRLLGSLTSTGPFELILEEELTDSRQLEVVPTTSFTFQATTVRYVQFIILDVWGRGGGLQYLGLNTVSQGAISTPSPTEGSNNTTGMTTTSPLPWESGSTSVDIEDGQTYDCQIYFEFALHKGVKVKNAQASCSEGTFSPSALQFAGKHFFEVTSTSGISLECSLKVVLVKNSVPSDVLEDTLACSPKDNDCFTTSGNIFPAPCVFPFIHNNRRYKACTDVGSKDPEKLWCPTELNTQGEAVPGQEGFCSKSCGYCAGSDVTSRADEPRPCGFDCLVSADWYSFPIQRPVITLEEPMEENYLNNSAGRHLLKMGDQIKITCPDTKFFADALKNYQEVFAKCGPTQHKFTVSSSDGKILDDTFDNDDFGCDACPTGYRLTFGYIKLGDFKLDDMHFKIASTSACSKHCDLSDTCQSFLFGKSTGRCMLVQEKVEKATQSQYSDFIICAEVASNEETCASEAYEPIISPFNHLPLAHYSIRIIHVCEDLCEDHVSCQLYTFIQNQCTLYGDPGLNAVEVSVDTSVCRRLEGRQCDSSDCTCGFANDNTKFIFGGAPTLAVPYGSSYGLLFPSLTKAQFLNIAVPLPSPTSPNGIALAAYKTASYPYYAENYGLQMIKLFQIMGATTFYEVDWDATIVHIADGQLPTSPGIYMFFQGPAEVQTRYTATTTKPYVMTTAGPDTTVVHAVPYPQTPGEATTISKYVSKEWNHIAANTLSDMEAEVFPMGVPDGRRVHLLPMYVGETHNLQERYSGHKNDGVISRWITHSTWPSASRNHYSFARAAPPTAHPATATSESFHLYVTFVEMETKAQAVIAEAAILAMFDFPRNSKDNGCKKHHPLLEADRFPAIPANRVSGRSLLQVKESANKVMNVMNRFSAFIYPRTTAGPYLPYSAAPVATILGVPAAPVPLPAPAPVVGTGFTSPVHGITAVPFHSLLPPATPGMFPALLVPQGFTAIAALLGSAGHFGASAAATAAATAVVPLDGSLLASAWEQCPKDCFYR